MFGYGCFPPCGGCGTEFIWILVIIFIIFFLFCDDRRDRRCFDNCR